MKVLYFECNMGAAGDMLNAALLDMIDDKESIIEKFRSFNIPDVTIDLTKSMKCGITGSHLSVKVGGREEMSYDVPLDKHHHDDTDPAAQEHHHDHEHEHHHDHEHEHHHDHEHEHHHDHEHEHHHDHEHHHEHSGYRDICAMIDGFNVSEHVKAQAKGVYSLIAEAEATVHSSTVDNIHFHEVGSKDAVVDVLMFCMLIEQINPDRIIVSPIHVGSGTVRCAHGILPVPAPATALILKNVPTYGGMIRGELCTPTGAALLKQFADDFSAMPVMRVHAVGYGMGNKDFPVANCVRAFIGDTDGTEDDICELEFNVDDMTPEELSFASERIFESGAVEVFTTPVFMKKGRPAYLVTVLTKSTVKKTVIETIFKYTSTIGLREKATSRYILDRTVEVEHTEFGDIRKKVSSGYGVSKVKYEYDDLAEAAKKYGCSVSEIRDRIAKYRN